MGLGGQFWCASKRAALPAQSVAIASSHCMNKLVYSSSCATPGGGALASLATSRRHGFGPSAAAAADGSADAPQEVTPLPPVGAGEGSGMEAGSWGLGQREEGR